MNLSQLSIQIPDFAKDIRLNLQAILQPEQSPGLTPKQVYGVAVASSIAAGNGDITNMLIKEYSDFLDEATIKAAHAASSIMAMNNVYYRFMHAQDDASWLTLPPRLRMTVLANPGIDAITFEMMNLAVSAVNGCGACIKSHTRALQKRDISVEGIQSIARIAAVMFAVAKSI